MSFTICFLPLLLGAFAIPAMRLVPPFSFLHRKNHGAYSHNFTIAGSCPIAGITFSTRSFVKNLRLDVLMHG